jgi:cytochrome c oxidase subunit 4
MSSSTHSHHILPLKVYFAVGAALLFLTIVTVAVALVDLGPLNLLVAMLIAAVKASLVALYFMHLKYDNKLYAVIFVTSLLFLATFIIFTMFDTMTRDHISPEEAAPINEGAVIYQQPAAGDAGDAEAAPTEPTDGR